MINHNKKQAGGTILGIIIGLILGLGIAVVVAVVITKTPVPLINRSPVRPDKAPEPAPGQVADPNKALYGNKEPAKEAAKEFAKEAPAADPAAADKKPDAATPAVPVAKPAADKPKPADGADAAKGAAKDAGKDSNKDAAKSDDDKWIYYLQAGAFRDQGDAENAKAKLALLGFETVVSERPSENGTLYRVRVGPFSQVEVMNRIRGKLSDNGVDVAVVRLPK